MDARAVTIDGHRREAVQIGVAPVVDGALDAERLVERRSSCRLIVDGHVRARRDGRDAQAADARPEDWVQARDERLAASYEHVGAGIVEVDEAGRMLRVNRQLCELTGYSAPELLGRTIFQETLPDDVDLDLHLDHHRAAHLIAPRPVFNLPVALPVLSEVA